MKKAIIVFVLLSLVDFPVLSAEFTAPEVQSVKSFSRPYDARFQYGLPTGKSLNVFSRSRKADEPKEHFSTSEFEDADYDDDDEITLDAKYVAPQRKIIKKLSSDFVPQDNAVNEKDVPMNYNAFPKFFDPNDMMNQQFMPMVSY